MNKMVTRAKGGTKQRTEHIDQIQIPDLWHIALAIKTDPRHGRKLRRDTMANMILEVWHLAHDLKRHIQEQE